MRNYIERVQSAVRSYCGLVRETPETPLQEFVAVLTVPATWCTLAWTDIRLRYRRTVLGPMWIVASTGVLIFAIGFLYAGIFRNDPKEFIPYLGIGVIAWSFFQATVIEGCSVFVASSGFIRSLPTSPLVHFMRMVARNAIILIHNALIVLALWLVFPWEIGLASLLVLPGLAIVLATALGNALTLAVVCTRFRDVPLVIASILQIMFLATPIIWSPGTLRGEFLSVVIDYNPLAYMIEVVRGPLLLQIPPASHWSVACLVAVVSLTLGVAIYTRYRRRLPYWL